MAPTTTTHKTDATRQDAGARPPGPGESLETADEIRYVHHASFGLPVTEQRLWGEDSEEIPVAPYSLLPDVEQTEPTGAARRTALSRQQEKTLFLRYNYAKYRLKKVLQQRQTANRRSEAETWRQRAIRTRDKILHANLPLVPAMAKRKRVEGVELADKISEGYMAVLRSVERFDVSRGFKFSTYACRSILAALYRLGSMTQTYRKHVPVQFEPAFERDDYADRRHESQRNSAIDSVRTVLQRNGAGLDDVQREILRQRFPLAGQGDRRPLWQVGRDLGVSTERVRQIEKAALEKLGMALEQSLAV